MKSNEAVIVRAIQNGWKIISKAGVMFIGGVELTQETVDSMVRQRYLVKQKNDWGVEYVTSKLGRTEAEKYPRPSKYEPEKKKDDRFRVVTPAPKTGKYHRFK